MAVFPDCQLLLAGLRIDECGYPRGQLHCTGRLALALAEYSNLKFHNFPAFVAEFLDSFNPPHPLTVLGCPHFHQNKSPLPRLL